MALDKVSAAMMSPLSVSETAPSNPSVGQRWYRASTAVTYQYTNDGTSSFWLDVSSSGIGTSAERGVDFVGDTDPHLETNGTGLAIGSVYYNREKNKHFVCTTATTNANVWSGRFAGAGGVETTYKSGSTFYRVHTFLSSGTFHMENTTSCDVLVIGGGAAGSADGSTTQGNGGGGAGGMYVIPGRSNIAGSYTMIVGGGGTGSLGFGTHGTSSSAFGFTAFGGGRGGVYSNAAGTGGTGYGSGGGGGYETGAGGAANNFNDGTNYHYGYEGRSGGAQGGGGGGGAGATGSGRNAGVGRDNLYRTGSNVTYAGGGAGGKNGYYGTANGGGGSGNGGDGTGNTGGGGAQGVAGTPAGNGGSGIIVIRYAIT